MLPRPPECRGCPLDTLGFSFSRPEGTGSLGVYVQAEALGRNEARDGLPLRPDAQAGSLFQRVLNLAGIDRQQLLIYNTVNCFLGDALVDAVGIDAAYRRWYSGHVLTLTTADGILTCTPNHPVLTPDGWLVADYLVDGDYLVCGAFRQGVSGSDPDIHRIPAKFDELFDSLALQGIRHRVIGSDVDFHGDGRKSEIEIVTLDRLLRNRVHVLSDKHLHQNVLESTDLIKTALVAKRTCDGLSAQLVLRPDSATARFVGGAYESALAVQVNSRHAKTHGGATVSNGYPCINESLLESSATNAFAERYRLQSLPIVVAQSKVLKVKRSWFSGHVYNLGTASNQYITNGFIVHNCQPPHDWLEGAPYEHAAIAHCAVHRERVMSSMRPRCIVALGNVALRTLTGHTGKSRSISHLRGYVLPALQQGNIPVVASYHPSFIQRGQKQYLGVAVQDLKLAVAVAAGRANGWMWGEWQDLARQLKYQMYPSLDDALSFLYRAEAEQGRLLTYDIETPYSSEVDEDDPERDKSYDIKSAQFSLASGEGIYLPWRPPYIDVAVRLLALPNDKAGVNTWLYDDPRLRASGVVINGRIDDLRWMWHHMQPDLPANAQFIASFYGQQFPWKHLAKTAPEFYGIVDVDVCQRIMAKLPDQLRVRGLWDAYDRQVRQLRPVLARAEARGVPANADRLREFDAILERDMAETNAEMQALVPDELRNCLPKEGYKSEATAERARLKPLAEGEKWARRSFDGPTDGVGIQNSIFGEESRRPLGGSATVVGHSRQVERWCRLQPFTSSQDQLIRYIKHRGHKVPRHIKEDRETTEAAQLEKLARDTGDPLYAKVLEHRATEKMRSTYVTTWLSGMDDQGRIHTTFTYSPASGQLASEDPNVQNIPKHNKRGFDLATPFRRAIEAPSGYRLVEFDYSGFHVVTTAFEARDPVLLRVARLDAHSYFTAHAVSFANCRDCLSWSDADLKSYLVEVRTHHGGFRDTKAKPTILGRGFGLGAKHAYEMNRDHFPDIELPSGPRGGKRIDSGLAQVNRLFKLLDDLFPRWAAYRNECRQEAHQRSYLKTRYGYIRWFFDVYHHDNRTGRLVPGDDSERCIAFRPSNDAHGRLRDAMLTLEEMCWNERAGFISTIHDSLVFCCPDELVDEAVPAIHAVMTAPSRMLVNELTGPEGLWCGADVMVGRNWASCSKDNPDGMQKVRL